MALQTEFKVQGDFLFKNRSYLPLLFLAAGFGVYLYGIYFEPRQVEKVPEGYYQFTCLMLSLLGLLIRVTTIGYTPRNTSGRNTKNGQIADELNTTGMYSLLRHPLYLGNFFMWFGIAMLTGNIWFTVAFVLLYWLYYERIMYAEESYLIKKFGTDYLRWSAITPAFIPNFKNYRKAKYPFCPKKVLKKEKNGFAAIFIVFWFFEWIGGMVEKQKITVEFNFWFYAAIASCFIYLILKIMKKGSMLTETNV
ncbi:isoprenylcysteine carboxyl methyltransferase (ICMT) family protein [Galbibacter orientalis DSM 19592]|uniref:Isoprenylcysteine carboxyl methyltransferase (ICMT) family protein n=1 Tax=Galbibacter orientalis DSM 19592 TaxID=926559 RepID=I3C6S1_9FLAO|nr:isoprenylcysteine carboxylmethyltransferase family protein [Galbibacter orientalis]EIJ39314.1 isoprenylcysteine carboxyl methyltransferase (ICMT) family protein [Galbibacter orientalis DSM 19592]